ncbi:hypothetical protein MSAN_00373100 [Mycena sanguinolenta]|uniref:Uncharacterized protein n=1 Tax=Mycena sanguinolenta TaxID=230812 RepID=A0A8H6ZFV0_9AGAR|nr:hypothetical protein MSAN_00373100 [Mycena sanguinolenta]
MFFKLHAVIFAISILPVTLGRPFDSDETHLKRVHRPAMVRVQVVRAQVVQRDFSATCTTCATRTVTVSGTATASAAFTVTFGSPPTATAAPNATGNFGSCSVPEIEFGAGFDGRKETSFRPVDQVSYNHASADDVGTITGFICDALINTCGADSIARATCAQAQAAAAAEIPQQGIDADAFNAVFGIQTNFKDVEALDDNGNPISTNSSATASTSSIATETTSSEATTITTSATTGQTVSTVSETPTSSTSHVSATHTSHATVVQSSTESAPTSAASSSASNNLQSFTGALGGISAQAVVTSGSQFQVVGNSLFNTKTDALSRSCDDQQNACADAANAAGNKGSLTVAACNTQLADCKAANGVTT